jgi:SAM-dependent methyltransferase
MTGRLVSTGKEVIRHLAHTLGANRAFDAVRVARGASAKTHLALPAIEDRFRAIYEKGLWRRGRDEVPGSGEGSTLGATASLRRELPAILHRVGAKTLLDIGCGDFTWVKEIPLEQAYIGIDIVRSVIKENNRLYANEKRRFLCLNAVNDELPDADVVLCREILFHLSFADALALLKNVKRPNVQYLIATTDSATLFNADVRSGDFRVLNLRKAPFRLPAPQFVIDDSVSWPGRTMGVWRRDCIPVDFPGME